MLPLVFRAGLVDLRFSFQPQPLSAVENNLSMQLQDIFTVSEQAIRLWLDQYLCDNVGVLLSSSKIMTCTIEHDTLPPGVYLQKLS